MLALATRQEEPAEGPRAERFRTLALLRYISHLPRSEEAVARQFLFVHTSPRHRTLLRSRSFSPGSTNWDSSRVRQPRRRRRSLPGTAGSWPRSLFQRTHGASLLLVERLAALAAVQGTVQLLALRAQFFPAGAADWEALRTCRSVTAQGPAAPLLDCLCGESGFRATLGVRLTAGLALLIVPTHTELEAVLITLLAATTAHPDGAHAVRRRRQRPDVDAAIRRALLLGARRANAADDGGVPLVSCRPVVSCLPGRRSLQSSRAPVWRSGEAITRIVNTRLWGRAGLARALRSYPACVPRWPGPPSFPSASSPLVLLSGRPGCYLFLLWGVLFHLSIAWVMGLNTFLWTFLATYPAIA